MKIIYCIILVALPLISSCQNKTEDKIHLSVAPVFEDEFNQKIITTLRLFLNSKDSLYTENKYWKKADFDKYYYPYQSLVNIEKRDSVQPSLMQISITDDPTIRIVQLAYIKHNDTTKENIINYIYNIVATLQDGEIVFSKYLDYFTRNWKTYREGSILYRVSPLREINMNDVKRQKKDVDSLCNFLKCKPRFTQYYSTTSIMEYMEALDFSFFSLSHYYTHGGAFKAPNIIVACNDSEYYFHEIVHLYIHALFPYVNRSLDEGFAHYAGGGGKENYEWHRQKLQKFLMEKPDFKIEEHIANPYEKLYFEDVNETQIPYALCGLICERTLRIYGKEKLIEMFKTNQEDIFEIVSTVGLTKENIDKELRDEINLPVTKVWQ